MEQKKFVHLHLHTLYSALDGAIKINPLAKRLKEMGMDSCAITDHGAMYGVPDYYKTFKSAGLHPIIGSEFYISPGSRFDKKDFYKQGEDTNYHLVLLAENDKGLVNLYKLSSLAFLEGFYYKPRIDKETLAAHSEGVIALSACLGGEICRRFFSHGYDAAKAAAIEYEKIMGRGNYFLEIQENGVPEQKIANAQLISISKETGIPLVATCDCHFLNKNDFDSHSILMSIQWGQVSNGEARTPRKRPDEVEDERKQAEKMGDISNFIGGGEEKMPVLSGVSTQTKTKEFSMEHYRQLYVKSPEEMIAAFHYAPEAIENTVKIAERCNVTIEFGNLHLPQYEVPEGFTISTYFAKLSREGLAKRLERVAPDLHEDYRKRLEEELEVIIMKGFDGYFLIVWDFINFSRRTGVPVGPGRGSGAGSIVAYALMITDIDPIRFNLLFERFLNPERVSMPDFDIDFCTNKREEVIRYVSEKYGQDRVAQIVTFNTLMPRVAVRDVCRVYNILLSDVDKLAKSIPSGPKISSFKDAFEEDPSAIENFKKIPHGEEILRHAENLEGLIRNVGMHAAGIVIADKPLVEYAPLFKGPKQEVIVQYEKNNAEKIGLIKFDFLGLKNLTIIDDAVKRIRAAHDPSFDISALTLDDPDVFALLQRGESMGVFQLESDGMKSLLKKLRPTVFEDIIAVNALYRPGPINSGMLDDFILRKHGEQEVVYDVPDIEDILQETYGVIVYQEQVMQIARTLGGYSLGTADILRRAMGKKDSAEMARQEEIFIDGDEKLNIKGARALGKDVDKSRKIFKLMAQFAEYGFNKSHSAAYAMLAYQTAYLKVKYPLEYLCALMSVDLSKVDDIVRYINEAQRMGVKMLAPDVNKSFTDFRVEADGIRFGLGAIKGIGTALIDACIAEREKNGEFASIYDFCARIDYHNINKKVLEGLITVGAFDSFGKNRRQLMQIYGDVMDAGIKLAKMREKGIMSLEDFMSDDIEEYYPDVPEIPEKELLQKEKEFLGFYLSSHPLKGISHLMETALDGATIASVRERGASENVIIAGIVKSVRQHITKVKREKMAFVVLEDLTGELEIVVFPRIYAQNAHLLEEDNIIFVKGAVDASSEDDRISMRAESLLDMGDGLECYTGGAVIRINIKKSPPDRVAQLKAVVSMFKGTLPVRVSAEDPENFKVLVRLGDEFNIRPAFDFLARLVEIPGYIGLEMLPASERCFRDSIRDVDVDFDELTDVEAS